MTKIMALAEWLFGQNTRRIVFEPLVADLHADLAGRASLARRLQWGWAITWTMLRVAPRATLKNLAMSLVVDIGRRALVFFVLAFALQWLLGILVGHRSGPRAWPPSFVTTIPFAVIPVIWSLRTTAVPLHQQRLLAGAFSVASMLGVWITAPAPLLLRAALTFAPAFMAWYGWRLYSARMRVHQPLGRWMAGFLASAGIIIASWPISLAAGIGLFGSLWPGNNLIPYVFGLIMALSVTNSITQSAPPR